MGGSSGSGTGLLVFVLFLLGGGGLIAFGVIFHQRGNARFARARNWMQGQARIIDSRVDYLTQNNNGAYTTSYRPIAHYSYQAGGLEREGSRVFLVARANWNSRLEADTWYAANQPGATVPVWYDPAKPADSAIMLNKPSMVMTIVLCVTGAFLLIGALFILTTLAR